jgi:hypothetical protein
MNVATVATAGRQNYHNGLTYDFAEMSDDIHQTLIVAAIVIGQRRVIPDFSLFKKRDETGQI